MANPTTNFGWVMPTATDLVTDLPADFAVFGQGVDTSMAYLLGGTTGQVLSKTSATDMAFTWINNDQGDLTAITAGTGISVTSGTGPIPSVAIDTTVTVDKTTAQTLTNKTLTSPALTTPTISTLTTNGDLLYGTGSGALSRLGIGSSAQVLTVASGVPSWATPAAAAAGLNLISTTTLSSSGTFNINSIFSATYKNYLVLGSDFIGSGANYINFGLRIGASNATTDYAYWQYRFTYGGSNQTGTQSAAGSMSSFNYDTAASTSTSFVLTLLQPFTTNATGFSYDTAYADAAMKVLGQHKAATSYDSMYFTVSAGTVSGKISVYGYGI